MSNTVELPNILWLVSEDNGPLIGAYGDTLARTPNIDALGRRGVLYRNAFCTAPVSAPSCFAILTGIHAESCGPAIHMRAVAQLPRFLRSFPELMRELGYYCTNTSMTDWNCNIAAERVFDSTGKNAHWKNRPRGRPFLSVFNTETTHESALYRLRGQFGSVDPSHVRVPSYLPDTPEIRADIACYYNAVEKMDCEIGAWIKEVEDAGLSGNTIIFYYSDNGGALPRTKRCLTDGGLRCALIVCIPPRWEHLGRATPGTQVDTPISHVDLTPTLLSLAGRAAPTEMQGTPFLGSFARMRTYAFGARNRVEERYDFVRAAMDGRFHYVRNYMPHRVFQHGAFAWAVGRGYQSWHREFIAGRLNAIQSKFFVGPREFEELYDLQSDPDQVKNLVGEDQHRLRLDAMRQALDDHMIDVNDNGFIPEGTRIEGYLNSLNQATYPLSRLMDLGARAARRNPVNIGEFARLLGDRNAVIRHWAILGIHMLQQDGASAMEPLSKLMRSDPLEQNRIVAAEAVASLPASGASADAVAILSDLLDQGSTPDVQLQAINALTFIGPRAVAALPAIRRAGESAHEYVRNAGRYLAAVLDGQYDPAYPVLDIEAFLAQGETVPVKSGRSSRRKIA